jgi:uncharacterized membrane protein
VRAASRVARGIAIGVGALAYAVLAHLTNATPGHEALGAVLALAPIALAALAFAWRSRHRALALAGCGLLAGIAIIRFDDLKSHFAWLYLIQQAGAYVLLAIGFGRTLGQGRVPLCSRFAAMVHGVLPPDVERYTRRVTVAWTVFFIAIAVLLVILYAAAPLPVWSAFANFGCIVLIALMFAVEYLIRRRVLPGLHHRGFLASMRIIAAGPQDSVATRRA